MKSTEAERATTVVQQGWAWVALTLALAVHVADEALTDFLSVWNPLVEAIRARYPWAPLPTFSFGVLFGGLILAVVLLLVLSRFVFQGAGWMVPFSYFLGVLMLGHSLLHIAGSFYFGRLIPGVYSSPLLLAASGWLVVQTWRRG